MSQACGQKIPQAHEKIGGNPRVKEISKMAEYELVHEIKNLCRNNQMRDVFFEEVECEDPVAYVRSKLKGHDLQLTREESADGTITIHVSADGLIQKFIFSPVY